ncbi:uncharacterized protein BXIN_2430 [Babesia sp. Xinjiang]|uniref:uncharacterized protein n=1 Tax=Babesia sp. Xinjiang TaxID=462227 RepID=UPI000A259593|nr:uncharacterized protein BXIN_2430 [Babesia sp. Xinjiang]ORM40235.1 hypothetical protein BXIN_2430 [Babesia sp. Xinjiang]
MSEKKDCGCGTGQQHSTLLCPPGNLKECIDWILRVTNKDNGQNGDQNGNGAKELGEKVKALLEKANEAAKKKLDEDKQVFNKVITQLNGNGTLITELAKKLATFIGYNNGNLNGSGIGNKGNGSGGGTKYTSVYSDKATWKKEQAASCARIFLGTIPVIFSGLSYLYWQCHENGSRWSTHKITGTDTLGIYFASCGYKSDDLKSDKKGSDIKTLLDGFTEFNGTATSTVTDAYPVYIEKVLTNASNKPEQYPLSSLYIASQYYFQSQFNDGTRVPTTIREMLYWLMALPYSGCFQHAEQEVKNGINKHTNAGGIIPFEGGPTLKPTDPLDCLISTTCHYTAVVLSTIQGKLCSPNTTTTTDETTKPNPTNIHDIYSNSHFKFNYPNTVTDWFNELWDVVYALMSQLYFLRRQCATSIDKGCGWRWCRYGSEIKYQNKIDSDGPLQSWICKGIKCTDHTGGSNCATEHKQCGQSHASPLQAFLTDCLTGFRCDKLPNNGGPYLSYSIHQFHRNFNQYCPVPMGFNHEMLTHSDRTGDYIYWILVYFTEDDRNSVTLYNTIRCLICTSLRTPRTVGDLFAFFLCAGFFLKNGDVDKKIPWSTESTKFTTAVQTLARTQHAGGSHSADLNSLHICTTGKTCGQYLQSLSYSIYRNISKTFAMSYLSRIVYLTDVFEKGLEELLTEFNNLSCENCVCKGCKSNNNCHINVGNCHCPTIVQCHNVLPLFFKFGFTFSMADALNGKYNANTSYKRTCSQFSTQLTKVITGEPFEQLLSVINKFLLCIRQPFLLYLLTFWIVAILYFTYGLTIPLDVLHLRSHWRPALSHQISVLALLSHKAMSPTKVGYFNP